MTEPSVGRIVHYVSYGTPGGEYQSECRAAIITEIPEMVYPEAPGRSATINVAVITPAGTFFNLGIVQDEDEHRGGTWHWPERVD